MPNYNDTLFARRLAMQQQQTDRNREERLLENAQGQQRSMQLLANVGPEYEKLKQEAFKVGQTYGDNSLPTPKFSDSGLQRWAELGAKNAKAEADKITQQREYQSTLKQILEDMKTERAQQTERTRIGGRKEVEELKAEKQMDLTGVKEEAKATNIETKGEQVTALENQRQKHRIELANLQAKEHREFAEYMKNLYPNGMPGEIQAALQLINANQDEITDIIEKGMNPEKIRDLEQMNKELKQKASDYSLAHPSASPVPPSIVPPSISSGKREKQTTQQRKPVISINEEETYDTSDEDLVNKL